MAALEVARARLHQAPTCRALFTELGADGFERLATLRLIAAETTEDLRLCAGRSAAAFTQVGSGRVTLCPALFSKLSREKAARLLIHEALHYAGLTESPQDPNGLTSKEINQLVRRSCRPGPDRFAPPVLAGKDDAVVVETDEAAADVPAVAPPAALEPPTDASHPKTSAVCSNDSDS